MVFVVLSNRKRHCIHTPLYSCFLTNTVIVISRTRLPDYLKTSSKSQVTSLKDEEYQSADEFNTVLSMGHAWCSHFVTNKLRANRKLRIHLVNRTRVHKTIHPVFRLIYGQVRKDDIILSRCSKRK